MDILNKPIKSFSFDDVVEFCKLGYREGWQLDYKKDLPKDGLSKHFASFSNTRGGAIVVGVEEDRKTGIPKAWDGVNNNAKTIEQINQWASNVQPIPSYEIHPTNEVNGKIFILVRIFEGDMTPYYVQNDANIWVRTGNISNPIEISSPDWTEMLFGKKEKALSARSNYLSRAEEVFKNALENAEAKRLELVKQEKENWQKQNDPTHTSFDPFHSKIYPKKLESEASMCTVVIQPYYPKGAITTPKYILDKRIEIRDSGKFQLDFPSLNMNSMPEGIMCLDWGEGNGQIDCEQLYATGLVYCSSDILRTDENSVKTFSVYKILDMLFQVLMAAKNFYQLCGYQGGLVGSLAIDDAKDANVHPISANRALPREFLYGTKKALLPKYNWSLVLDTTNLNDEKAFQSFFIEKAIQIEWDLGYIDTTQALIEYFLKERHWYIT